MQKYTDGYSEIVTIFEEGDKVMFQSPNYPELLPYPVVIRSRNESVAGSSNPYYRYVNEHGDLSNLYYKDCFTEITEPVAEISKPKIHRPRKSKTVQAQ